MFPAASIATARIVRDAVTRKSAENCGLATDGAAPLVVNRIVVPGSASRWTSWVSAKMPVPGSITGGAGTAVSLAIVVLSAVRIPGAPVKAAVIVTGPSGRLTSSLDGMVAVQVPDGASVIAWGAAPGTLTDPPVTAASAMPETVTGGDAALNDALISVTLVPVIAVVVAGAVHGAVGPPTWPFS